MSLNGLPQTSNGLYLPPKGYPDWHSPLNENFKAIDAYLNNKVRGNWKIFNSISDLGLDQTTATLDDVIDKMPDLSILYALTIGATNTSVDSNLTPYPNYYADESQGKWGFLTIKRLNSMRIEMSYSGHTSNIYFTGKYNVGVNPKFRGWKRIAVVEPPIKYSLSLASGILANGENYYAKSQEDLVNIRLSANKKDNSSFIADSYLLATLPVGFRPKEATAVIGFTETIPSTSYRQPIAMLIYPSGAININHILDTDRSRIQSVNMSASFFAAFWSNVI